jgi:hypothetical protein
MGPADWLRRRAIWNRLADILAEMTEIFPTMGEISQQFKTGINTSKYPTQSTSKHSNYLQSYQSGLPSLSIVRFFSR